MKKRPLIIFCGFFLLHFFAKRALAQTFPTRIPVQDFTSAYTVSRPVNQVIVVFKSPPNVKTLKSVELEGKPAVPKSAIPRTNAVTLDVQTGNIESAISSLKENTDVKAVFPNFRLHLNRLTNDTFMQITPSPGQPSLQWNLFNLKLAGNGTSAWDKGEAETKSANVTVAVIDSGVDSTHPDLAGKISSLIDCTGVYQNTGTSQETYTDMPCREVSGMTDGDPGGHGTHVAGLIGAGTDNSLGIAGSGFNTRLMILKVMDEKKNIYLNNIANAIVWAADNGARVINISAGAIGENIAGLSAFTEVFSQIISLVETPDPSSGYKGALIVAAAGNCGPGTVHNSSGDECDVMDLSSGQFIRHAVNPKMYPAALPDVLAVGATDINNNIASYSDHNDNVSGNWISVAAPGGKCTPDVDNYNCILSVWPGNKYKYMQGTSMAAPQVSAVASLIFAVNPAFPPLQVKEIIEKTANGNFAKGANLTSYGLTDALTALSDALTEIPIDISPSPTGGTNLSPTVTLGPTATMTPSATPAYTPTPTLTPYPTSGVPQLPKIAPEPYPSPPFCPQTPAGCTKKHLGDANCDDMINEEDYLLWEKEYGFFSAFIPATISAGFKCVEDDNDSHFVDMKDFEIWRKNVISIL